MNLLKVVVYFSTEQEFKELSKAEEAEGKLSTSLEDNKLMHSVLNSDKKTIDQGNLIEEAINRGIGAFTPDLMFEQLVKNFQITKQIYGEKIIRLIAGYNPDYIERNLGIPEFRKELKEKVINNIQDLKDKKLVDKEGVISDKGIELASIVLYAQEIDNIVPKGLLGKKISKELAHYGERTESRMFRKGDRYKDISLKQSVRLAVKRGHSKILSSDLRTNLRRKRGSICLIYAIDASASMKGKKIETTKKAGVALAYKAINNHDKVGLVVFGTEVKDFVIPTLDFGLVLNKITRAKVGMQTDFTNTIKKSVELFPKERITKHLIILTDALPTVGEKPEKETLEAVSIARSNNITVSIIGISLDEKGKTLAEKIVGLGEGRLYVVRDLENLDKIVLEDYYAVES